MSEMLAVAASSLAWAKPAWGPSRRWASFPASPPAGGVGEKRSPFPVATWCARIFPAQVQRCWRPWRTRPQKPRRSW